MDKNKLKLLLKLILGYQTHRQINKDELLSINFNKDNLNSKPLVQQMQNQETEIIIDYFVNYIVSLEDRIKALEDYNLNIKL